MEQVNTAVRSFDNTMKDWLSVVDTNEYISAAVTLFLILYAGLAAPRLPEYLARLFENPLFQLLIFFLIIYSAQRSPTVAIIAAIGLMVSLNTLTSYKMNDQMMAMAQRQEEVEMMRENMRAEAQMESESGRHMNMQEGEMMMEEEMPEDVLAELQREEMAPEMEGSEHPEMESEMMRMPRPSCSKKLNYRNSFYPQYVNMKPDAYMARFTNEDVSGYDPNALYSSL